MNDLLRWALLIGAAWFAVGLVVSLLFGHVARRGASVPRRASAHSSPRSSSVADPAGPAPVHLPPDVAIVLHGLINSSFVVLGGLEALRDGRRVLSETDQHQLIESAIRQAKLTHRLLNDLMTDASHDLRAALEGLASAQIDYQALAANMPEAVIDVERS